MWKSRFILSRLCIYIDYSRMSSLGTIKWCWVKYFEFLLKWNLCWCWVNSERLRSIAEVCKQLLYSNHISAAITLLGALILDLVTHSSFISAQILLFWIQCSRMYVPGTIRWWPWDVVSCGQTHLAWQTSVGFVMVASCVCPCQT